MWQIQYETLGRLISEEYGTTATQQRQVFDERVDIEACWIVARAGRDCGFLSHERRTDHLYLGNLVLGRDHQRRGIGSAILRDVIAEAQSVDIPVRLQVLKGNPARRFYELHGFVLDGETDHHFLMIRPHCHGHAYGTACRMRPP